MKTRKKVGLLLFIFILILPVQVFAQTTKISGTVQYNKRFPTSSGLSQDSKIYPAPLVKVDILDSQNKIIRSLLTDEQGNFSADVPQKSQVKIRAFAQSYLDGGVFQVFSDPIERKLYYVESGLINTSSKNNITLTASLNNEQTAGAFNIIRNVVNSVIYAKNIAGIRLKSLSIYWKQGVMEGTYYRNAERAIYLLGGEPNNLQRTDTDQFDDSVIVHEFGHFLFESMAPYLRNIGGDHSGNTRLDPRLAFNEALGTWFSSLVLNNNEYQDTVGISPNGNIRVDHNLEFLSFSTHGFDTEESCMVILWDLIDGSGSIPDRDNDGAAVSPADMFRIIQTMSQNQQDWTINTFLQLGVTMGLIQLASANMLAQREGFFLSGQVIAGSPYNIIPQQPVNPTYPPYQQPQPNFQTIPQNPVYPQQQLGPQGQGFTPVYPLPQGWQPNSFQMPNRPVGIKDNIVFY